MEEIWLQDVLEGCWEAGAKDKVVPVPLSEWRHLSFSEKEKKNRDVLGHLPPTSPMVVVKCQLIERESAAGWVCRQP